METQPYSLNRPEHSRSYVCTPEPIEFSGCHTEEHLSCLTEREREIHPLVIQGYENEQIATRTQTAARTVRNHVSAIFGKLGNNAISG